jgi:hypothetical protein
MTYYTYILKHPLSNIPFYIGKGKGKRCLAHQNYRSGADCQWNKRLGAFIGKLNKAGVKPLVEIVEKDLSEDDALILEEKLILQWGRKGIDTNGILLNFYGHKGDSTITRPPVSADTRAKLSAIHKGKKKSPEAKANMAIAAIARMARMQSDGSWDIVKAKNAATASGKKQTAETISKRAAAIVAFKDANGGKRTFSEQARANIAASMIGKKRGSYKPRAVA